MQLAFLKHEFVLNISIEMTNPKIDAKNYFVTSADRSLYARWGSPHRPFCSPGGYIDWCCPCVHQVLSLSLAAYLSLVFCWKLFGGWRGAFHGWNLDPTELNISPFFIMGRFYQEYNFQGVWTNFEHSVTTHGFAFLMHRCPAEFLLPDATWGPQLPVIPLIHSP